MYIVECKSCKYVWKRLTRYRTSKCPKCGLKLHFRPLGTPGQTRFYDISNLEPGGSLILPWDTETMMYTTRKSQVMRQCVSNQAKKLGWQVECIRHIAGLKVIRLA